MLIPSMLAFDETAVLVIRVAWIALAILIFALLALAARFFFAMIARADDVVFRATLDLDRSQALVFHELYHERRPKNVAIAWVLAVIAGPIGAFGYLRDWPRFSAALFSLNGLGAWWIESWFSVPQMVLIQNERNANWALEQLPAVLKARADVRR